MKKMHEKLRKIVGQIRCRPEIWNFAIDVLEMQTARQSKRVIFRKKSENELFINLKKKKKTHETRQKMLAQVAL